MNQYERRIAIFMILLGVATSFYSVVKLKLGTLQEPGPGFFPFVCGLGIVILCLIWFITSPKVEQTLEPLWSKENWIAPTIATVLVTLYTYGLETLGYCASTLLFLLAWQFAIEREKWLKTSIIAIVGTAAMYVLFSYLLQVPLPEGLLI